MTGIDISIDRRDGFYAVTGHTEIGREFIDDNATDPEDGSAETDHAWEAMEIADSAVEDGLAVSVDGKEYSGLLN